MSLETIPGLPPVFHVNVKFKYLLIPEPSFRSLSLFPPLCPHRLALTSQRATFNGFSGNSFWRTGRRHRTFDQPSGVFHHLIGHPLGHGRDGFNIYPFGHSASAPHFLRRNHSAPVAFHVPCRAYSG